MYTLLDPGSTHHVRKMAHNRLQQVIPACSWVFWQLVSLPISLEGHQLQDNLEIRYVTLSRRYQSRRCDCWPTSSLLKSIRVFPRRRDVLPALDPKYCRGQKVRMSA